MKDVPGIPFGDPLHPYRQTTETARKAGKIGKRASPWSKSAACSGARAERVFAANNKKG